MVRASASGSEGRGFVPRPRHTKGVKNGTGSSLADARNKRVVLGRYKDTGRFCYPLCRSKSSTELMLSVSERDVQQNIYLYHFYCLNKLYMLSRDSTFYYISKWLVRLTVKVPSL